MTTITKTEMELIADIAFNGFEFTMEDVCCFHKNNRSIIKIFAKGFDFYINLSPSEVEDSKDLDYIMPEDIIHPDYLKNDWKFSGAIHQRKEQKNYNALIHIDTDRKNSKLVKLAKMGLAEERYESKGYQKVSIACDRLKRILA